MFNIKHKMHTKNTHLIHIKRYQVLNNIVSTPGLSLMYSKLNLVATKVAKLSIAILRIHTDEFELSRILTYV